MSEISGKSEEQRRLEPFKSLARFIADRPRQSRGRIISDEPPTNYHNNCLIHRPIKPLDESATSNIRNAPHIQFVCAPPGKSIICRSLCLRMRASEEVHAQIPEELLPNRNADSAATVSRKRKMAVGLHAW
jgi:hypothetical protein